MKPKNKKTKNFLKKCKKRFPVADNRIREVKNLTTKRSEFQIKKIEIPNYEKREIQTKKPEFQTRKENISNQEAGIPNQRD